MGKKNRNNDPLIAKPGALADTIIKGNLAKERSRTGKKRKRKEDEDDEAFVGGKESSKILKQAREQLNEISEIEGAPRSETKSLKDVNKNILPVNNFKESDEEEDDVAEVSEEVDEEVDEELKKKFEAFMPETGSERQKIAEEVIEAIESKKSELESRMSEVDTQPAVLSDELRELFREVGKVMHMYRSGPVPKPFKIIPKYSIWQELLEITEPEKWSAAAIFAGTKIFVSNLKDNEAGIFMKRVLLPRVRDDISEYKKLNDHLYNAMLKCMFKSFGFIKGFLLPLCRQGDFFSKEATIVASVLDKSSLQMKHAAAAMMEISRMEYSPGVCIILTTLVNKKYALPQLVIHELKAFFLKVRQERELMPVLWHQCLLTFVQNYKDDLCHEGRKELLDMIKLPQALHRAITPDVRKELLSVVEGGDDKGVQKMTS